MNLNVTAPDDLGIAKATCIHPMFQLVCFGQFQKHIWLDPVKTQEIHTASLADGSKMSITRTRRYPSGLSESHIPKQPIMNDYLRPRAASPWME